MTAAAWRLIDDGERPGAFNMALDVALLAAVAKGDGAPVLRFYGWTPPCLSLGRHQPAAAADLAFCQREGIDVIRRPTGGRAVLHHLELTYSVIARPDGSMLPLNVQEAYRSIAMALVAGLTALGVRATLTDSVANTTLPRPTTTVPCFRAPAGGEIVAGARKLVGSAMRLTGGAILQHGSILLGWDGRLQAGALGLADDSDLRPHVTTLSDELGYTPDPDTLRTTLAEAFERTFGITLDPGAPTPQELERAAALESRFQIEKKRPY